MLNALDRLLDRVTTYRLLLYYLIALVLIAIGLSFLGVLHFNGVAIAASTAILVTACWFINKVFATIFQAPTNVESVYITALILALIITPLPTPTLINVTFLLAASGLAMASKYILTIGRKHIFNPAAIAVALTALGPRQSASWWVGTTAMLPYVVIGGILLARRTHRGRMVTSFFVTTLFATVVYTMFGGGNAFSALDKTVMTSAMLFLGFVMLTEPMTTPPTARKQTWYAVLTGLLFPPQVHILKFYSTPELALLVGNLFSYVISPKTKLFPTLQQKVRITRDSLDFIFTPHQKFSYKPGQYMEWTLPHYGMDSRGDRRYFTLASSPTEPDVRIGVKFYKQSSTYKKTLFDMTTKTPIVAAQIAGDFVLPKDQTKKLVFIAGGIGITPYRSMIKYLLDTREVRPITLLYSARTAEDFAYKDVFSQAEHALGIKVVYVVTDQVSGTAGPSSLSRINADMIEQEIPNYQECLFYISGTQTMVKSIKHTLYQLGVRGHQIKTDYFSGYT